MQKLLNFKEPLITTYNHSPHTHSLHTLTLTNSLSRWTLRRNSSAYISCTLSQLRSESVVSVNTQSTTSRNSGNRGITRYPRNASPVCVCVCEWMGVCVCVWLTRKYIVGLSEQVTKNTGGIARCYLEWRDNKITWLEEIDALSCSILCKRSVGVCVCVCVGGCECEGCVDVCAPPPVHSVRG